MNSRADLIEVATRVFAARGYNGASLRDIAQAAGIQRGSVYHHIASKEELLLEGLVPALERTTVEVEAVIERALGSGEAEYGQALDDALRTHLRCLYGESPLEGVRTYLAENLLASHSALSQDAKSRLRRLTRRHEANFARLFEAGRAAGAFQKNLDPKLQAYLVLGMCNWLSRWYRPNGAWSLDHIADAVVDTVLRGCLAG